MIYGTLDEIAESGERSLKLGRLVAVNQFTKALLRHGSFEEYRFYCESLASIEKTREQLETSLPADVLDRAILTLQPNLHTDLATSEFAVLHHASGWGTLAPLSVIRNRYAMRPFPVTSQIHSLNEPLAPLRALRLALSQPQTYDAIICSSECGRLALQKTFESLRERLKGTGFSPAFPGTFAKIPLAIDDDSFAPREQAACRKALDLPSDATVLLHLGRISAHSKGDPAPLFYLFRRLVKARPGAKLLLVLAGGAEEENVRSFQETCSELGIADRVVFRPNFEDEQKALYYGAADVFVSLIDSLQETFGISLVEAMACGKALVVSDFDGYREIVEHGKSGLTVPTVWGPSDGFLEGISGVLEPKIHQFLIGQSIVVDIAKLSEALLQLIDNPSRCAELGAAARQRALSLFTWKTVIPQYEALWKELGAKAASAEKIADAGPDPFTPDFFRSFSHYPAKLVTPQWKARLTDFGKEAIRGDFPAMYSNVGVILAEPWLKLLLQRLAKGSCSVGELVGSAAHTLGAHEEHVLYHLLWLAKYDVISLSE